MCSGNYQCVQVFWFSGDSTNCWGKGVQVYLPLMDPCAILLVLSLCGCYETGKNDKTHRIVSTLAVPGNVLLRMSGVATRTVNKSENGRHFFFVHLRNYREPFFAVTN